jgi:hypothetical protein
MDIKQGAARKVVLEDGKGNLSEEKQLPFIVRPWQRAWNKRIDPTRSSCLIFLS